MRGFVVVVIHAVIVALVLAALVSLDVSLATKVLLAAFSGMLVFAMLLLQDQAEKLNGIYTTLRLIFVSVETRRLDRRSQRRAVDILAADIEQEKSDQEIGSMLSGPRSNSIVFWLVYLIAVAIMAAIGIAAWPK